MTPIIADLARWSGLKRDQIDRKTLAVTPRQYLTALLNDEGQTLNTFDMRRTDDPSPRLGCHRRLFRAAISAYDTRLAYAGIAGQPNDLTAPSPGSINARWDYNSGVITPEIMAAAMAGEGPPGSRNLGAERDQDRSIAACAGRGRRL